MSIKGKLRLILWSLFVIPTLFFSIVTYNNFVLERRNTYAALEATLTQISAHIESNMNSVSLIADHYAMDDSLQAGQRHFASLNAFRWLNLELQPRLITSLNQSPVDIRIILYFDNPTVPQVFYSDSEVSRSGETTHIVPRRFEIIRSYMVDDLLWFVSLEEMGHAGQWMEVGSDSDLNNLSYIRPIYSRFTLERIGYIRIVASRESLFYPEALRDIPFTHNFLIYNGNDRIFEIANFYGQESNILNLNTYLDASVPSGNMSAVLDIPLSQINVSAVYAVSGLIISIISGSLILLGCNFYLSRHFRERLTQSELAMLQAQLNPHFLYNMLSTIAQLARMDKSDEIQRMARYLARFYRLTLSKNDMIISLEEEFKQIRAYIRILRIKYMDKLTCNIDYPEQFAQYETLRFILQPFVENSIVHAWCNDTLEVSISGRFEGDDIVLTIADNGIGIDETVLTEQTGKYGIVNVDERIKLQFGKNYGVTVKGGQGTVVNIRFPAVMI